MQAQRCNSAPLRPAPASASSPLASSSNQSYCLFLQSPSAASPVTPQKSSAVRADSAPPTQLPSFELQPFKPRNPLSTLQLPDPCPSHTPTRFTPFRSVSHAPALPTVVEDAVAVHAEQLHFANLSRAQSAKPLLAGNESSSSFIDPRSSKIVVLSAEEQAAEVDRAARQSSAVSAIESLGERWIDAAIRGDVDAIRSLLRADPYEIARLASMLEFEHAQQAAHKAAYDQVIAKVEAKAAARGVKTTEQQDQMAAIAGEKAGQAAKELVPFPPKPDIPSLVDYFDPKSGNTALMFLCSRGRRDGNRVAVVELLNHSQPPNLDARNRSDGRSALMLACSFGHHEIVTLLLAHTPKLSIDLQDNEGLNALMHCSSSGWIEIARLLLTQQPAPDMTMRTNGGSTAIALARNTEMKRYLTFWKGPEMCAAAAGGDLAVVTALLQTGTDVDYQSETGATVLINASKYGRFAVVRYVLANQPRPSLLLKDNNGLDALHHASVGDHQECMHLLLTTKTRNGFTPRLPLPASASTKCMKKACSAAFSLNVWQSGCHFCGLVTCAACVPHTIAVFAPRDNKPMPVCDSCYTTRYRQNMNTLMIACARGKPDAQLQTVQAILTFKPLPRLDDQNSDGETALQLACASGHLQTVRELLAFEVKPSIDLPDRLGRSPCMRAAAIGHVGVVKLLLDSCRPPPSLVLRDQNNFTAVMHSSAHPEMVSFFRSLPGPRLLAAAQAGDVTTCTTLLDQGVPIDYQDEQGSSALMRACEHGHEAVARLLLQRNPPPLLLLRDKQPRTAVMLASEFDRVRVAKAFFDHLTANPGERSFMPRIELNAESMDHCMKAVCRQPFSMFRRRQVCGSCRLIVCSDCAPNKRKIPFGFAGKPSNVDANKATVGEFEITRVCTLCDQCLPK